MEQDIQPQQEQITSLVPSSNEDKTKSFIGFLSKHYLISAILFFFIICILSVLFYFLVILNVKISKTDNQDNLLQKYSIVLKDTNYQIVFNNPQYVCPYYSLTLSEFNNKVVVIRNDIPQSMQNFLMIRGVYQFYFSDTKDNLIREILSDTPGFIRHPIGFLELLIAKYDHNQYGYEGVCG